MAGGQQAAQAKDRIPPVYIVYGKDRRRVTDTVEAICRKVLGEADRQVCLNEHDGLTAALADVLDDVRTAPFLWERRLVLVKDADHFIQRWREALEAYLDRPSATGVLLLAAKTFPPNTRLARRVAALGEAIACEPPSARALGPYLADYARQRHGLRLGPEAIEELIELAGADAGPLCPEVDKLAAYVWDPRQPPHEITAQDVQAAAGHNRRHTVFEVIDAMTENRPGLALQRLDQMLRQDRQAQYRAVGAFAWHFRRLYRARLLVQRGAPEAEILNKVRVWRSGREFLQQVRRLELPEIGRCLRRLLEIDVAGKTGGSLSLALAKFVVDFCQERGPSARTGGA